MVWACTAHGGDAIQVTPINSGIHNNDGAPFRSRHSLGLTLTLAVDGIHRGRGSPKHFTAENSLAEATVPEYTRGVARLTLGLLGAVVLVVPGVAGAWVHVCGATGEALPGSCECEEAGPTWHHAVHERGRHHDEAGAELEARDCCRAELQRGEPFRAGPPSIDAELSSAKVALARAIDPVFLVTAMGEIDLRRERGPPFVEGCAIYKQNCSFLN